MGKARKNNVEASDLNQVIGESDKIIKYAVCLVRRVAENCMRESKNVNRWTNGCTSRQSPNCKASLKAGVKATKSVVDGTKVKCSQDGQEEGDERGME